MTRIPHKLISLIVAALVVIPTGIFVFADELRAGTVAGLPEKLVVLDDNGNSVSENGEYFFAVNEMQPEEVYTKNIQIMNLREDASYKIFFSAQPLSNSGEINLEDECVLNLYLDDRLVYSGKVTGEGSPDVRDEPMSLGQYGPGESRILRAEVVWHDSGNAGGIVDNGARYVDSHGTTIIREKTGKTHIEGEVLFKWIFTATADAPGDDDSKSYVKTGENLFFVVAVLFLGALFVMMILLLVRKRKKQ